MSLQGKVVRSSVVIFYLLIGLEIIIIISPFAAYFYAGYGPLLNALYAFPATARLTSFFLPHAVVSESDMLNFVNSFGRTLFSLGIIAFLIGAFQIYTVKHLPLLRVDVDTHKSQVLNVDKTAPRNYWGQVPMPAF